ncbi:hypothetical protein L1987_13969 [Smallanthus sonchifolius]|uniref:Uncharacterized protein n=1 Tax=Smallanthus sonchifolius TaxID=185202 RepID=A0ACB9JK83_9ASTR|nr:hypothetical protein L1987_13969 [Smallanthus sonchifolius]
MPSGMSYFVKKVNWSPKMFQLGSHDLIEQELEVLGRLRNSSVMIPLAYTLTTRNAHLFYEFTEKGTLFDVLHRSLGTCIMLKSLNEAQIGDIELSKVIDPSKSIRNLSVVVGSVGYVPPEYAYTMRVTMAGNVYSFGVILLELLTGKTAVSEGSELAKWVESKEKHNFDQILDSTVSWASQAVRDQMLAVLKVVLACVSVSPEARPDMMSVLHMLHNARN